MAGRENLHDLRQRAHEMGIQGSSKMSQDQLQKAMKNVGKGTEPMRAKQQAKGHK